MPLQTKRPYDSRYTCANCVAKALAHPYGLVGRIGVLSVWGISHAFPKFQNSKHDEFATAAAANALFRVIKAWPCPASLAGFSFWNLETQNDVALSGEMIQFHRLNIGNNATESRAVVKIAIVEKEAASIQLRIPPKRCSMRDHNRLLVRRTMPCTA